MKRLTDVNLNTSDYYDGLWKVPENARYDPEYSQAFVKELPEDGVVADVCCGLCGWADYAITHNLRPRLFYDLLDFSPYVIDTLKIKLAGKLVFPLVWDALKYPPLSETAAPVYRFYSFVGSSEAIEHFEDPQRFVDILFDMTHCGGKVMVGTLNNHCSDAQKLTYPEHLWEFTPQDLIDLFVKHSKDPVYELVGNYHTIRGVKE